MRRITVPHFVVAGCAAIALAPGRSARADGARVQVRIAYDAPPGCPTRAGFVSRVSARRPDVAVVDDGSEPRRLVVAIREERGSFAGEIASFAADRRILHREVGASSCEEVCDALAFIAAIGADPATEALPSPAAPGVEPKAETPETAVPAIATPPQRWSGSTGARIEIEGVGVPAPLPGFRAWLDVERAVHGPAFRFSVAQTLTATATRAEGSAHFSWTTFRLEGCPFRWSIGERVRARPCVGVETGFVRASGDRLAVELSPTRPWFAASASANVAVALSSSVSLEIEAAAIVPLYRDSFFFQQDTAIYKAPAVWAAGGAGVSMRLW
jgi:hypothetical protein